MLESMQFFGHYADLDTAVEFFDIWITFFTHFSVRSAQWLACWLADLYRSIR